MAKRTVVIGVRVTAQEAARIRALAEQAHMSVSEWMRRSVFGAAR